MADFAPPTGPPPPKVPAGYKAVWNDQYKEWFYVNIYTKKSQWNKPTEPIYPPDEEAPGGPPPLYDHGDAKSVEAEKSGLSSNNPYASATGGAGSSHDISEDERLARQLQEEENARAQGRPTSRGASDSYYQQQAAYGQPAGYGQPGYGQPGYGQPGYTPTDSPMPAGEPLSEDRGKAKGGFLGKLLGKGSHSKPQYGGYPPQQQYYGGPPQGQYGGYPPQQGYYQGYPPQQQYGPPKKSGMGAGTAAALGVGGGLLGGVLLGEALEGGDGGDGGDYGGDDGGDGGDF